MIHTIAREWLGDLYEDYAKFLIPSSNGEKHHILPKSLFPEHANNPDNIIQISVMNHMLAHEVLSRTGENETVLAFHLMFTHKNRRYSNLSDDDKKTVLKKLVKAREMMKIVKSEQAKKRTGTMNSFYGKTHSEDSRKLIGSYHVGKKLSSEHKNSISNAQRGRPKTKVKCPHCHKMIAINLSKRWHFDNCKHKGD